MDSNHRPHAYQACALTRLSYRPHGACRGTSPKHLRKAPRRGGLESRINSANGRLTLTDSSGTALLRKEVIQPQVLLQLPCYDFTPITKFTIETWPLAVTSASSSAPGFRDVTGGVYKARERIHRIILIHDY